MAEAVGSVAESTGARLRRLADDLGAGLIEAAWLVALVTVPVYFNVYSSRSFEPDKVALLTVLAGVVAAAWLARVLAGGALWPPVDPSLKRHRPGFLLVAATAAFLVASSVATVLSVSPSRSWHGSFFRQQGLTTLISYLVIALAVVAFIRRAGQWRRAATAIVLGSVPVCVYALVQRIGLDAIVPPDDIHRVSSSLGNPIFLGSYLALSFLVTLSHVVAGPGHGSAGTLGDRRRLAFGTICALQLAAMVLSQSRGPLLGLGAGLVAFGLAWSLGARGERAHARWTRIRRHLWLWIVAVGAAGLVTLALLAARGSQLGRLRNLPTVGRLAAALDPTMPTARVRLLIWRGVVELETSAPPLRGPDGRSDRLDSLRPVVGYGPDCFDLAFNRVFPARLGVVESRQSIPDRAHSETFDVLVTTGALGLGAWLALMAAALAVAGTLSVRGSATSGEVCRTALSALFVAVVLALLAILSGRADLAGVLAPAGLVVGVCAALIVKSLRGRPTGVARPGRVEPELALAAFSGIACHAVEASVGIPVTASSLLLWFLIAALASASLGRIKVTDREDEPASDGPPAAGERVVEALLAGVAVAVATSSLMDRSLGDLVHGVNKAASGSLWSGLKAAGSAPAVLVLGALAAGLALWASRSPGPPSRRLRLAALAAAVLPVVALWWARSHRLATAARMQREGASLEALSQVVAGHADVLVAGVVAAVLALAVLLVWRRPGGMAGISTPRFVAVGTVLAGFVAIAATLVAHHALAPIRADTYAKQAAASLDRGQPLPALELLSRASWNAPDEPAILTLVARATVLASRAAVSVEVRERALDAAVAALERAARLQPFDPDHAVNLGRVFASAATWAGDAETRQSLLGRAEHAYARGLELRPGSVLFRVEHAGVLVLLGHTEAAAVELRSALALDPGDETGAMMLASLERARAVAALGADREGEAERHFEAALAALQGLLEEKGGDRVAERAVAALYARLGRGDEATAVLEGLVDGSEPAEVHEMLALLYLEARNPTRALEEAETVVRLASARSRPRAEALLELVGSRASRMSQVGEGAKP